MRGAFSVKKGVAVGNLIFSNLSSAGLKPRSRMNLTPIITSILAPWRATATSNRAGGFYAEGPETPTRRVFRRHEPRTVLYVEDDITDVILLNSAIETQGDGVRLVAFRDPAEALLVCSQAKEAPDLVILDINMPKIGGFELYERLKDLPAFNRTVFVFLTTSDNFQYRSQAKIAGIHGYYVKPRTFEGYPNIAKEILGLVDGRRDS